VGARLIPAPMARFNNEVKTVAFHNRGVWLRADNWLFYATAAQRWPAWNTSNFGWESRSYELDEILGH